MTNEYPAYVVGSNMYDERDGFALGDEVHGPFRRPGKLWLWAVKEYFLDWMDSTARDQICEALRELPSRDERLQFLDEYAATAICEYEGWDDSKWWVYWGRQAYEEDDYGYPLNTDRLRPIGQVNSCGCEDWPMGRSLSVFSG